MEEIDKNIEAIEQEKKEYLAEHPEEREENVEEDVDVNEIEFSLTEDEINLWLMELIKLKEEKNPIELEIDDENSLSISYEESEEGDDE